MFETYEKISTFHIFHIRRIHDTYGDLLHRQLKVREKGSESERD